MNEVPCDRLSTHSQRTFRLHGARGLRGLQRRHTPSDYRGTGPSEPVPSQGAGCATAPRPLGPPQGVHAPWTRAAVPAARRESLMPIAKLLWPGKPATDAAIRELEEDEA